MDKIKYFINKYKFYIIIIIISLLIILFCLSETYLNNKSTKKEEEIVMVENKEKNIIEKKEDKEKIENYKVDIKGEVKKPGVYELIKDSRVIDVINMAGGLTKEASTEYLNLSKKITDEMVIIIYSKDEIKKYKKEDKEVIYIEYECECIDNINDACINESDTVNTIKKEESSKIESSSKEENNKNSEKISINEASKEELMTLTGIGEGKAVKIIEYREENGEFEKIEDLMNVSGIGESIYKKIKDFIKL